MPKIKTKRDDVMDEQEVLSTLKACNNSQVQALISLMWMTGARIGELKLLRAKDISNHDEFIYLDMPTLKTRAKASIPKRRLKIPKGNVFYDFFKRWVNDNTFGADDFLFNYSEQWFWKKIKEANPETYPHFFRHSAATHLSKSVDAFTLKEWFGWKTMDMPMRYVHRKDAMEKVFSVLKDDSEE